MTRPTSSSIRAGGDLHLHQCPDDVRPLATFYLTTVKAGNVRGLAYSPGDILRYDNAIDAWSVYFDASDVGITKALSDFVLLEDDSILLAFKARVKPLDQGGVLYH